MLAVAAIALGMSLFLGCDKPSAPATTHPSSSASVSAIPGPSAAGPPSGSASSKPAPKPYDGPVGTLTGTVTLTGDPPPSVAHTYPKGCESAAAMYGTLFRTGQGGTLADALVTVTNYKGVVTPSPEPVKVTIRDCAFSTRTSSKPMALE